MATPTKAKAAKDAGASVATIPNDEGDLEPLTPELVKAWLDGDALTEDDVAEFDAFALAQKILGADTPEKVLSQDDIRKSAELVGETFAILGVVWRKSVKREDGKGRYAVLSCADEDGAGFMWSCGATKVVLQVRKAQLEKWLPWVVTLNSEETNSGNTVYELVAPSPDF